MAKMFQMNVHIPNELNDELVACASKQGITKSEFVRRSLKKAVKQDAPVSERDYETAIKYAILKLAFLESSNETSESTFEQLQYFSKQLDKNSQIKKLADFVTNSEKNVSNLAALLENEFIDFEENV